MSNPTDAQVLALALPGESWAQASLRVQSLSSALTICEPCRMVGCNAWIEQFDSLSHCSASMTYGITTQEQEENTQMFEEKLSEIKKQLEFISNPLAWCVNIGSAVVSWKYWDGINMSAETTADADVTIGALLLMVIASAWIFVDGDEKVRRYFKREGVPPLFASDKDLEDINNDRVKTWLKTHYSLDKYDKACSLAITWVFTLLAIALVEPSPDTSSAFGVQHLPKVGLCLSAAICVLVHWFRHKIRKEEDDKWFSLSGDFPIIKNLPGFKNGYIMCKSPKPLTQWGLQDRYVIKTSMVNSSRMPGKDSQDRKDVMWRLLQLSE